METKITIAGDLCLTPPYVSTDIFSEEVVALFRHSDLNIVNLECPVVPPNHDNRIWKTGPHLSTTSAIFAQLKKLNIHVVSLANNHILDFGERGLTHTINECKQHKIKITGAGENLPDASQPTFTEQNGLRVALVNFCENEWSVATARSAGANPLDPISNLKQIKTAKSKADFVVVIIHGGHEHFHLPSPRMVKTYRYFAENGADAIIGHHPHCISGYEYYKQVPIFYSLGNFAFTLPNPNNEWNSGLIVQLKVQNGKLLHSRLFPTRQSQINYQISLLANEEKERKMGTIKTYSKIIADDQSLEHQWHRFVLKNQDAIDIFSPAANVPGRYARAFCKKLKINDILIRKKNLAQILNHIRCESHKDILTELLELKMKSNKTGT